MPDPRLVAITHHLTRGIPEPYRAPARPQKSWATIELKRELKLAIPSLELGPITLLPVDCVEAVVVDSQGLTLAIKTGQHKGKVFRWTDKDWKTTWVKVPKRRKKKEKLDA